MLGKTNIIYVAKDQNSKMQFVAETIITRSSSNIKKIKYLNGLFFVFTEEDSVLYGGDIKDLSFLKNGENLFTATNVEYYRGKYIFINSNDSAYVQTEKPIPYYISEDLTIFQKHTIDGISNGTSNSVKRYICDIFINSYNQLVFCVCVTFSATGYKSGNGTDFHLCICTDPEDNNFEIRSSKTSAETGYKVSGNAFMRDRLLGHSKGANGIEFCHCITMDAVVENIEGNYCPVGMAADMAYISIDTGTYYSLNFKNYIKIKSGPTQNCFLIRGQIGLYNEGTLELASKVTDFSAGKSTILEVTGIDYEVLCYATTDEYTYLGCEGGIIIQCLLDVEGSYQTPEIALVKTLAAKQALEQAQRYTDEKIAELKNYVDNLNGSLT